MQLIFFTIGNAKPTSTRITPLSKTRVIYVTLINEKLTKWILKGLQIRYQTYSLVFYLLTEIKPRTLAQLSIYSLQNCYRSILRLCFLLHILHKRSIFFICNVNHDVRCLNKQTCISMRVPK